jgi:hypothetical protein
MEGHLGDPAEPWPRHEVVVQDEPRDASELLWWPRHDALLPVSFVIIKTNQVERPRESRDDPDLAPNIQVLRDDIAWAEGAAVDNAEATAGCKHGAVGAGAQCFLSGMRTTTPLWLWSCSCLPPFSLQRHEVILEHWPRRRSLHI